MHVFVTGASGFVGEATVKELIAHGHTVTGLARSESSVTKVSSWGATPLRGDMDDLSVLTKGASNAEGVIHLAFKHDFTDFDASCASDRAAIQALADGIPANSDKPLYIASGTLSLPKGILGDEDSPLDRDHPHISVRALSSDLVFKLGEEKGFRGGVVRLSPTVHGKGDHGLLPQVIEGAKKAGAVPTVGNGARWPAVHREDAARVFRLALEKGVKGRTYHAVAEIVKIEDILGVFAKKLGTKLETAGPEQIAEKLGFAGMATLMDNPVSSEKTQKELGWTPQGVPLLPDLEANYF